MLTYARRNLGESRLSVEEPGRRRPSLALASSARPYSRRPASRRCQGDRASPPLAAARAMMEDSNHPIDIVAEQTGFADRDRMRRAFLRAYGQPPQVIRRNARGL